MASTKDRRSIRTLWADSRTISQHLVIGTLIVGLLAWVLVSMAVAQSLPEKAGDSVKITDLVRFQWWAITGLISLVGILIGFFIIREMNSQKLNIRNLWKEKLSEKEHEKIDHSSLCAVCRTKTFREG